MSPLLKHKSGAERRKKVSRGEVNLTQSRKGAKEEKAFLHSFLRGFA